MSEPESPPLSPRPGRVIVEADGGSRGNPGPAAYGAVLRDADSGQVLGRAAEAIGTATNNVAEYQGLIAGLRLVAEHAAGAALEVRMDSKLVIEQMAGRWRVKHADLVPLARRARELAPEHTDWVWVPRESNTEADALLNRALDGKPLEPDVNQAADPVNRTVGWGEQAGPPTSLVLVRHGVTAHTRDKRFSGRDGDDPSLTTEGQAQAKAAAARVLGMGGGDVVLSSPLRRARETADIVADTLDLPVGVEDRFAETAFGAWDGYTFAEIQQHWPDELTAWLGSTSVAPPGGESFEDVRTRVQAARDWVLTEHAGRRVVIVTHVTPIKLLVGLALDVPTQVLFRMELAPASISEVHWYPDGAASLRSFSVPPG